MNCDTSCPRCEPWPTIPDKAKCWRTDPRHPAPFDRTWVSVSLGKRCVFPKLYHTTPDSGQESLFPKEER